MGDRRWKVPQALHMGIFVYELERSNSEVSWRHQHNKQQQPPEDGRLLQFLSTPSDTNSRLGCQCAAVQRVKLFKEVNQNVYSYREDLTVGTPNRNTKGGARTP